MSNDIRAQVATLYGGMKWKDRVATMSNAQVYAIWIKQQRAVEAAKDYVEKPAERIDNPYEQFEPQQLSLNL